MIECLEEKIFYKKHRKNKFRRCFSVLLTLIIIFSLFAYYKNFVTKSIYDVCYKKTYAICTHIVNKSILLYLNNDLYEELVEIEKDDDGNIVLMTANALEMNVISREMTVEIQEELSKELDSGIEMPYLIFTGIGELSGYGRKFNFNTLNVSSMTCDFRSNFKSAGINQTLHSIYLTVITNVIIDLPFSKQECEFATDVLLCESILIGKIPEVYLNGNLLG